VINLPDVSIFKDLLNPFAAIFISIKEIECSYRVRQGICQAVGAAYASGGLEAL
jgi:hypothetical protein